MSLLSAIGRIFHPHRYAAPAPPADDPAPIPAPIAAHQGQSDYVDGAPMHVVLHDVSGFTDSESQKLERARQLFEQVLNSQEFKDAVLQFPFVQTHGLDSAGVYAAIEAAQESFKPGADHQVDLNMSVRDFSWFQRHVVGYTTPDSPTITVNRRFFDADTPAEIAGNLAHEWMHKLGFDHDFNATARRPYSVPYAIGELVERLAGERG